MTFWIGLDLPYRFFHKKQYSTFDCMRKYGIVHSKLCHSEREREREMSALPVAHISGGQSFECHWKKTSLLACSTFSYWRGAGGTLYLLKVLYCVGSVLVDDSDIVEVEGAELYFWVLSSKLYWYHESFAVFCENNSNLIVEGLLYVLVTKLKMYIWLFLFIFGS